MDMSQALPHSDIPAQCGLSRSRHVSPLRSDSIRTTLPSMRHMVVLVPELTGYATLRHVAMWLPYAAQLIYGKK